MTWQQIIIPLYVAAGVLYVAYNWKRVVDDDGPEIRKLDMLTGHQLVPVLVFVAVVAFAIWPIGLAWDLVQTMRNRYED